MRNAARLSIALPAALAGWTALAGALTAVAEPAPIVAVFGPRPATLAAMAAAGARLVDAGPGFIRVAGGDPGFVARLYVNGALLVLPARQGGCLGPSGGAYGG